MYSFDLLFSILTCRPALFMQHRALAVIGEVCNQFSPVLTLWFNNSAGPCPRSGQRSTVTLSIWHT